MTLPVPPGDDAGALRDVMGLFALPALWAGRDARAVLDLACDAARTIVPFEVALARLHLPDAAAPLLLAKVGAKAFSEEVAPEWRAYAESSALRSERREADDEVHWPGGQLRWFRLQLSDGARAHDVWFASRSAGFPNRRQSSFLRAMAAQAAGGLHAARLDHEKSRAARAKDEFLAVLGHELRNPLAPIVTSLSLIRRKGAGGLEREIGIIERQVESLGRLVDDLLDVSRITRGKVELRMQGVEIGACLVAAVESVSPLIEERRHRIAVHAPERGLPALADPARLRQIFANLLINAAKYTDPGGRIEVHARAEAGSGVVEVKDSGAGLDAELTTRLFGLFEQGPGAPGRSNGGLGIGLAIVKTLVELHGGRVSAYSPGVGQGSTFEVRLPLAEQAPETQQPADPGPGPGRSDAHSRKVMLVDDNRDALETLAAILGLAGFLVVAATSPVEALEKAGSFEAEAFVLDIGLPGMDGYELASQLRVHGGPAAARAKFIALTGFGQAEDKARAARSGFDRHLTKPVQTEELIAALEELLGPAG